MLKEFIKNEDEAKCALFGTILADGSIQKERYTASNKTSYRLKSLNLSIISLENFLILFSLYNLSLSSLKYSVELVVNLNKV